MHDDVNSPAGFHMRNSRAQLHFSPFVLSFGSRQSVPNFLHIRINEIANGGFHS